MSGEISAHSEGEQFARASEAGGDFIGDEQDVQFVAKKAQFAEILRMIEPHAAGALHDGFYDDGGDALAFPLKQFPHGAHG